jgi:glucose dehydrogenase
MRLKKVVAVFSVAVTVAWLTMPAWAQKGDKFQNPYVQAELEEQATRVITIETAVGTVTRYKGVSLPQVDAAASSNWGLHSLDLSNSRYLEFDQINTSNVKSLVPVWAAQTFIYRFGSGHGSDEAGLGF